jgi:hypothetical protein
MVVHEAEVSVLSGEEVEIEIVDEDLELVEAMGELVATLPDVRWTLHTQHGVITGIAGADIVRVTIDRGLVQVQVSGPWRTPGYGETSIAWLTLSLPQPRDAARSLRAQLELHPQLKKI